MIKKVKNTILNLFEAESDTRFIAIFRIIFFFSVFLHFIPSIIYFEENYTHRHLEENFRSVSFYLESINLYLPEASLRLIAYSSVVFVVLALIGFYTRISSFFCFLTLYSLVSINSDHTETLGLQSMWCILYIFIIFPEPGKSLSVSSYYNRKETKQHLADNSYASGLIIFSLLTIICSSGVEKIIAGWPSTNVMHTFFNFPQNTMIRAWVYNFPIFKNENLGYIISCATVIFEVLAPFLMFWKKIRIFLIIAYEIFFLSIFLTMEIPFLFFGIYAALGILLLPKSYVRFFCKRQSNFL
jgi:uncharacterized membrane protein YphA (DoxX/SURF4 family)